MFSNFARSPLSMITSLVNYYMDSFIIKTERIILFIIDIYLSKYEITVSKVPNVF